MIRKHLLSSVAAIAMVAVGSGAGLAADLPVVYTPPAPVASPASQDWSGLFVGALIGYMGADFSGRHQPGSPAYAPDPDGFGGGFLVGYNWQMNSYVLGAEADILFGDLNETSFTTSDGPGGITEEVDMLASIRARVGFLPQDNLLLFATAGIGIIDATHTIFSHEGRRGPVAFSLDDTGFVLGGGAEWRPNDSNFALRIQGLYYFFDESVSTGGAGVGSGGDGDYGEINDAFTVMAGATYRFSDMRLKRDVALLARLENGIGLYRYRYLWSDEVYVGVMAQEAAEVVPDAVTTGPDGYLRVDYKRLGRRLMTWDEWIGSSNSEFAIAA